MPLVGGQRPGGKGVIVRMPHTPGGGGGRPMFTFPCHNSLISWLVNWKHSLNLSCYIIKLILVLLLLRNPETRVWYQSWPSRSTECKQNSRPERKESLIFCYCFSGYGLCKSFLFIFQKEKDPVIHHRSDEDRCEECCGLQYIKQVTLWRDHHRFYSIEGGRFYRKLP